MRRDKNVPPSEGETGEREQRRSRFTYANVAATTALVVAIAGGGGAAFAAAKGSIGSFHIKNGTVQSIDLKNHGIKSVDIGNGQVRRPDLGNSAVNSGKVANNSLTGADIRENSLNLPALPSIAESAESGTQTLSVALQDAAVLDFTAPAAGYVKVTATANFKADETGTYVVASLRQDGTNIKTAYMDPGDVDGFYDQAQSVEGAIPVSKGAHTYRFQLSEFSATDFSDYFRAQLQVEYFPAGTATVSPRTLPRQQAK